MAEGKRGTPRRQLRLLLALPVLLAVAVAANWTNVNKLVHGKTTLRNVLLGFAEGSGVNLVGWTKPADTGDPKAKVTIEVFMLVGDACHIDSAYMGQALGTVDPKRVRVKFVDTHPGTAGAERRDKIKLGCEQGLAINGKTEFKLPDPEHPGKQKTVFLTHDGAGNASLYVLLNRELKAAYKGKGLTQTKAEFDAHMQAEMKRSATLMEAEAKVRQEEEKKKR